MKNWVLVASIGAFSACAQAAIVSEGFDTFLPAGWASVNRSAGGGQNWFQGNSGIFTAHSGAADSYAAVNFLSSTSGGNASNWLISPEVALANGNTIGFRTRSAGSFPDRMEVRLSTSGSSTDVGATDTSTGDFGMLLLTINGGLSAGGYPADWTSFTATVAGLGGPGSGRFAFRYWVEDTSINGDYVGLDSVEYGSAPVPEPTAGVLAMTGLAVLYRLRAWRDHARNSSKEG